MHRIRVTAISGTAKPIDPKQALRMRRYFMAAGTSLLAIGLLFACHLQGVLSSAAFYRSAALILMAILAFYIVFRSGLNLRFSDPNLAVPQILATTLITLYTMYAADGGRSVFLLLLLMGFLFSVLQLTGRALLIYAMGILCAYGGVIALLWRFKPQSLDLRLELLQWLALALTLPWFAAMGGFVSGLRNKLRHGNKKLQGMLQRVQASEASLAQAQRIAGLGGWTLDPARRRSTWSVETYRLLGMDPAQPAPSGEQFLRRVHSEDRRHYNELIKAALREGRDFDDQFRIVLPSGEIRWMHALGQPVVNADGHTTSLCGTIRDITEHIAQEEALTLARDQATAARATLVDAIESLTEAFCLFDPEDRLVLCNRRYVQSFSEFDRIEDIIGMRFEDLVRSSLARGEVIEPEFQDDVEGWVRERIRRHLNPSPKPHLLQLGGGRWLQVSEQRTRSGGIVGVRRDISESKAQEQALSSMANSDALTALPNRHWLMGFLPFALERARSGHAMLALLFVDLDDFKNINDTMGHAAGDELLKSVSSRLRSVIRPADHIVRLGGDEFTIILEHPESAGAVERVGERIIAALREPFLLAGHSSHVVYASIGISLFPQDGDDVDTLLKHADIAMYAAKANGKAGYRFFQPQLSQNLIVRLNNEQALRAAIEGDEFALYYQPRVDAASGELRSLEALVRWMHPQRGMVAPDEFIPLAEETGLIVKLGELMIGKVCAQLACWKADNLPLVPVSINVSLRQFNHGNIQQLFALNMRLHGIAPALVEIELTESCMMGEDHAVFEQLAALKLLGVKLLLDDFGTGYSSLSQLQRLDLDILKVDKAFTATLGGSKEGEVFFMAIISMAHVLNMSVVAEGVETLEQLRTLQELSCNEVQGFFISRPLPADEISQLMRQRSLFSEDCVALPLIHG